MFCYESGNRRAEVDGSNVRFLRVTGNVRRSAMPVLAVNLGTPQKARRMALRWVRDAMLGKAVLEVPLKLAMNEPEQQLDLFAA